MKTRNDPLPTKYTNLLTAIKAGCTSPEIFFLSEHMLQNKKISTLTTFLKKFSSDQTFIVRSAVTSEDGDTVSHAGFFYSSNAIPKKLIKTEILHAYTENSTRANTLQKPTTVNLMVSPFITGVAGGVAFSPWLYFYDHALVQYSTTPQTVVTGKASKSVCIPHTHTEKYEGATLKWSAQLASEIKKLHKIFDFQLDIEWVYDGTKVYILQVRPVTIAPSAIQTTELHTYTKDPKDTFDIYGTSLGKLSPLSFELITHLYTHAQIYWAFMYIKGGTSFLRRIANGSAITDTERLTQYFTNTKWHSPFKRQIVAHTVLKEVTKAALQWSTPKSFSIHATEKAFSYWQTAQAYERLLKNEHTTATFPFEYEIGNNTKYTYGTHSLASIWKQHFQNSLLSLREEIKNKPSLLWSTLENITTKNTTLVAKKLYMNELAESMNAISIHGSLIQNKFINGNALHGVVSKIEDPMSWGGPLPKKSIIMTTHIPSSWIMELPHIQGIIVTELNELAHAAIVLREHNVPTLVVPNSTYLYISDGDTIDFSYTH